MPKFFNTTELSSEIEKVINNANEFVYLISPYIKLSKGIKRTLDGLKSKPEVMLVVVFGKNEGDYFKSINKEDLDYLMEFPNLEVRYEPDLHAKVYMNEYEIILSSMNLYDYSQQNNIEFGVYGVAKGLLGKIGSSFTGESFDEKAVLYFLELTEKAKLLIDIEPQFEKSGFLGLIDSYEKSKIIKNELFDVSRKKVDKQEQLVSVGYCIRTGVEIPFNPKMPMSDKAHASWSRFEDPNYSEKYCHFSGEKSNGETSFSKPILRKNWSKAMR